MEGKQTPLLVSWLEEGTIVHGRIFCFGGKKIRGVWISFTSDHSPIMARHCGLRFIPLPNHAHNTWHNSYIFKRNKKDTKTTTDISK